MQSETITQHISALNAFLPNIDALYLISQEGTYGFYLPKRNSRCITIEYLLQLSNREVFSIEQSKAIKYDNYKILKIEKIQLYKELMKQITKISEKKLGFTYKNLPNKKWLVDVLFTINPDNTLFTLLDKEIYRTVSAE